jgi:hypothetical protein
MHRLLRTYIVALLHAVATVLVIAAPCQAQMTLTGAGCAGVCGGGGGPVFPTLPGLAGRWNALAANVSTSGGHVVSATDLSGNGNNLTPSGGNVPWSATGWTGSLGSRAAFGFVAANNALLAATNVPMGTSNTGYVCFVGQMLTNTAGFGGGVVYGAGAVNDFNGTGSAAFFTRLNTSNGLQTDSGFYNSGSFVISLATNYRVCANLEGSGTGLVSFYLNNVLQVTAGLTRTFSNNGNICVGGRYASGPSPTSGPWEGPIVEIVVGSGTLSSTDLNNLDAYFTAQWGT